MRGIWAAATGMMNERNKLDAIADNLANSDTGGFKRSFQVPVESGRVLLHRVGDTSGSGAARLVRGLPRGLAEGDNGRFAELLRGFHATPVPVGYLSLGVRQWRDCLDFSQGPLRQTNNPFDLAVVGDGLFAVSTPNGVRYTRDGRFTLAADGMLTTLGGHPVLGVNGGPIRIPPDMPPGRPAGAWREQGDAAASLRVGEDGRVWFGGEQLGTLALVRFPSPQYLEKQGDGLCRASPNAGEPGNAVPGQAIVRQGYLELSNVDAIEEMVNMIEVMRSYEANQRAIRAQDGALSKVINELVRF